MSSPRSAIHPAKLVSARNINADDDDFVFIEATADESAPLMPSQPRESWARWAITRMQHATYSAANTALYIVKHPLVPIIATLTAAPSAINALVAATHDSPADIGREWWDSLTTGERALSVTNCVTSFAINTAVNAIFLPQAAKKLKDMFVDAYHKPTAGKVTKISTALALATSASFATGMIARNSFLWLPASEVTAFGPAALSFLSALGSRSVGVLATIARVGNLFNDNAKLQRKFIDRLAHLDADLRAQLKAEFDVIIANIKADERNLEGGSSPASHPLTKGQFYEITKRLAHKLNDLVEAAIEQQKSSPIKDATRSEQIGHYAGLLFCIALGMVLAIASFLAHMQKGSEGVNLLTGDRLTHLNKWHKRVIGTLPGLAPAMLYGVCGLEIGPNILMMMIKIYCNLISIFFAIALLVTCGLTESSWQNVAEGIVNNPSNIIGIKDKNGVYAQAFIVAIALGCAITNLNPLIKRAFGPKSPLTLDNISYDDYMQLLTNYNDHLISNSTTSHLKTLGLFRSTRSDTMTQPLIQRQECEDCEDQVTTKPEYTLAGGML